MTDEPPIHLTLPPWPERERFEPTDPWYGPSPSIAAFLDGELKRIGEAMRLPPEMLSEPIPERGAMDDVLDAVGWSLYCFKRYRRRLAKHHLPRRLRDSWRERVRRKRVYVAKGDRLAEKAGFFDMKSIRRLIDSINMICDPYNLPK